MQRREAFKVLAALASMGLLPKASGIEPAFDISLHGEGNVWLQAGHPTHAYWIENNRWGAAELAEGVRADQYEQYIGVSPSVGPRGEVAFRTKWRWPQGSTEVKGYPALLYGRKPGYFSHNGLIDGKPVRQADGTVPSVLTSGQTPGTRLPLRLPIPSLKAHVAYRHVTPPTGQGQLTFDIWLQSSPTQDAGFTASSITHEIMIPLDSWGGYGAHGQPGGRNANWYDHTATIGGRQYHVYVTKGADGAFLYNFGYLNGAYGKSGWKMIAFVPAVLPVPPGEIDLAAFINYLATRTDIHGNPWALGNEYVVSVELGVEPVVGTGDLIVHDYRLFSDDAAAGGVAGKEAAAPADPTARCLYPEWVQDSYYLAGSIVTYRGRLYVATHTNPGYNPTISTYFWAPYACPAGATATPATPPDALPDETTMPCLQARL